MASAISAHAAKDDWKQQFKKVSDEYFDQVYFHYAPTQGTLAGYHQYDAQLEDYSRKNIDAEIADLKRFQSQLEAIHPDQSPADFVPRSDRERPAKARVDEQARAAPRTEIEALDRQPGAGSGGFRCKRWWTAMGNLNRRCRLLSKRR